MSGMPLQTSNTKTVEQVDLLSYKNPKLSIDERVADLLSQMTLEEKVAQMLCIWNEKKSILLDENENISLDNIRTHFKDGIGQIARLSDLGNGLNAVEMANLANKIQKFLIEETRLGIPVIIHEECLHGLAAKEATSYPQPIGLASTFNPELIENIYATIADDMRKRGAHQALTPVVDVARDPRWGRVEETFGEDPYLIAQLGIAAVKGFQGDASFKNKNRVIATLKHFAAHGQPEAGSNCAPGNISERVLRDVFLYPFKEVIQKGKAISVMPSYNEIDSVPSHANKWLLKDVLKDEWNFEGFLVSDYYGITELHEREEATSHAVAKDKSDAARIAVEAGVNLELPDKDCYPYITELVTSGKLDDSVIDELVGTLLKYKFILGLFDEPYVDIKKIQIETKLERDRTLAKQAACETVTLLKNDGDILPLKLKEEFTLAVIGPNADRIMLGGYSGKPKYNSTVLQGITDKVGSKVKVLYSEGCKITVNGSWEEDVVTIPNPDEDRKSIELAVETAKKSDIVILVLGGNEQTSREAYSRSHLGDRTSLDLFGMQNELIAAINETGKPIIAILFNGRPNSINYLKDNIPAILECWYLGQESGYAVADVLFGNYNPSGKLPISIPRSVGHIPCYYNHKPSSGRGYLLDDASALFPFGYGLSYTTFSINNLKLKKPSIGLNESTQVSVDIENIGSFDGEEVVQMYIRDIVSSVTRPVKELRGFKKISLKPGETKTVSLDILPEHLAFTDINKEYVVESGDFEIMVGNSSRDEDLLKTILKVK